MATEESSIISLNDVRSRNDFEKYLFSGGKTEEKLEKEIGVKRNFLRRITGRDKYTWKEAVEPHNAEGLCKYIASRENMSADEVLKILKDKEILFKTTVFSFSAEEPCILKNDLEEEQDVIANVKAVVKDVMQKMHYSADNNFKMCEGTPLSGYMRVARELFVPFTGTMKWEYIYVIYISSNISNEDLDNKFEYIKGMQRKKEMLIFILCEGVDILKKVRNINTLGINNSIIVANQHEYDDLYIISMCKKHKTIFELEKEWAEDVHLLS